MSQDDSRKCIFYIGCTTFTLAKRLAFKITKPLKLYARLRDDSKVGCTLTNVLRRMSWSARTLYIHFALLQFTHNSKGTRIGSKRLNEYIH